MLDILDFIADKGGDLAKISESQVRRYASTELINEVIELYDKHRQGSCYVALQLRSKFNFLQAKYSASQVGHSLNKKVKEIKELRKVEESFI